MGVAKARKRDSRLIDREARKVERGCFLVLSGDCAEVVNEVEEALAEHWLLFGLVHLHELQGLVCFYQFLRELLVFGTEAVQLKEREKLR